MPLQEDPIEYLSGDFKEDESWSKLSDTELIWGALEDPLSIIETEEPFSALALQSPDIEIKKVTSSRLDQ